MAPHVTKEELLKEMPALFSYNLVGIVEDFIFAEFIRPLLPQDGSSGPPRARAYDDRFGAYWPLFQNMYLNHEVK